MIPRILEQLDRAHREFSWKELCYELLPSATLMRWRCRAHHGAPLVEKAGPKKPERLNVEAVRARVEQLNHGRERTAGTTALYQELAGSISRRRFQELVEQERANQYNDMKRIQWLVPGTVWSLDTTEYGLNKTKITPLRDLGSKYQLPIPLAQPEENGQKIAEYLNLMFKQHGPPMFLKRDLGSPLNCAAVDQVLELHSVLPLNSPPGYPRYNGSMERSMVDLKGALDQRRLTHLTHELPIGVELELVTHQLNHRSLRSLGHKTPCQLFHGPTRIRFHGASRQRIVREVFEQFWQYLETMPNRTRHQTQAAWRLVVECWLRRQQWIIVRENQPTKVSTISKTIFSQN
jgi:hypothetical protein